MPSTHGAERTQIGYPAHSVDTFVGSASIWRVVTPRHPVQVWRVHHLSMVIVAVVTDRAEAIDVLAGFRERFYRCLNRRSRKPTPASTAK